MIEPRTISPGLLTQHPGLGRLNKQVQILDLLGLVPDQVIANLTGISSRERVRQYRELLGIRSETRGSMRDIPGELLDKLGKLTDSEIARQTGTGQNRITILRRGLGIPPAVHARGPGCKYPWADIVRDWNTGMSAVKLSEKYNVKSPGVIYVHMWKMRNREKNT